MIFVMFAQDCRESFHISIFLLFSASATVTILITDINDHAPRFTEPIYQTTMSENSPNGASVTSVSATDKDIGKKTQRQFDNILVNLVKPFKTIAPCTH